MKIIPITLVVWLVTIPVFAQKINWQNMDLLQDSVFGISTERAYTELLAYKKAKTVIVAVLDVGVDTSHEDLKGVFWSNPRELPGNGIDDDHNGYIDDIHGWNFLGGPKGDVQYDNLELTRLIRRDKPRYDTLTAAVASGADRAGFLAYRAMLADYTAQIEDARSNLQENVLILNALDSMAKKMGGYLTNHPSYENLKKEIREDSIMYSHSLNYDLNLAYDPRPLVGDDYNNDHERLYGNANIVGPDPSHGTFIAGIIAAIRGNHTGIDGVADHVQIMVVRMGCDGDERDKDVANAIRYAVDNGAKVINMSFGKYYSWDKKVVDEAVKYAMSKDLLMVNGAGNDGLNLDDSAIGWFPSKYYEDGSGHAGAWITVVAGLAALIREYYPRLSAVQVKEIIQRSVVKPTHAVIVIEGSKNKVERKVYLSDICTSGGVVNAYAALKLAATY